MARAFEAAELSAGWEFRQTDDEFGEWLPVARVPTNVHLDLMDNDKYGGTSFSFYPLPFP